jgi:hypothetical protein
MANGISRFNLPTDLNVSGGVGVTVTGSVYVQNSVSASAFSGSGAAITNITASNIFNFGKDVKTHLTGGPGIIYDPSTGAISASFTNFELTGAATTGTNKYNIVIQNGGTNHPSASLAAHIEVTSVTASFSGSGAGLSDIPASSVVGLNLDRITTGNVTASVISSEGAEQAAFSITKGGVTYFKITNSGSVAIGLGTDVSSASYAHAEGQNTHAYGPYSHAEGYETFASGNYSHAQGIGTIASGSGQAVLGKYNTQGNTDALVIIGNGTNNATRKDLFIANIDGVIVSGSVQSTTGFTGSLSGTATYAVNADHLDGKEATEFALISGSNVFSGSQVITGNLNVTGRLTAFEYYTQFVTSSVIMSSGSTQFGNSYDDVHRFSGSIFVSGGIHTQEDVTLAGALISDATIVTLTGSQQDPILAYSTNYLSSKLIITAESAGQNNNNQTMEVLVLRNSDSVYPAVTWVPYAVLHTSNTPVFSISAEIVGGSIVIKALNLLPSENIKIRTQKIYSLHTAG